MYAETGSSHEKTTTVPLSTTQAACVWFILPCRVWPGEEHPSPLPEGAWDGIGRVIQGSLSSAVLCPCGEGSCWQLGAVLTRLVAEWHLWTLVSSGRALQALCAHSLALPVGAPPFSAERSNELRGFSCSPYKCPVTCTFVPVSRPLWGSVVPWLTAHPPLYCSESVHCLCL